MTTSSGFSSKKNGKETDVIISKENTIGIERKKKKKEKENELLCYCYT